MGFLPVASGDGSDEGGAGLGGTVRTSGRGCPGVTAGPAPGNNAIPGRSGDGTVRVPVPGCFTGHGDHISPNRLERAKAQCAAQPDKRGLAGQHSQTALLT